MRFSFYKNPKLCTSKSSFSCHEPYDGEVFPAFVHDRQYTVVRVEFGLGEMEKGSSRSNFNITCFSSIEEDKTHVPRMPLRGNEMKHYLRFCVYFSRRLIWVAVATEVV